MEIASPWDQRVHEKEGENIEKYQDLKKEIGRLWGIKKKLLVSTSQTTYWKLWTTKRLLL